MPEFYSFKAKYSKTVKSSLRDSSARSLLHRAVIISSHGKASVCVHNGPGRFVLACIDASASPHRLPPFTVRRLPASPATRLPSMQMYPPPSCRDHVLHDIESSALIRYLLVPPTFLPTCSLANAASRAAAGPPASVFTPQNRSGATLCNGSFP